MPKVFTPLVENEEICAKCSRESGGCCIVDLEDVSNCPPLSLPEILRLLPFAHLAKTELLISSDDSASLWEKIVSTTKNIHSPYKKTDIFTLESQIEKVIQVIEAEVTTKEYLSLLPFVFQQHKKNIEMLFPLGEYHFRLRILKNGACTFLGEKGCRLPRHARPWYCQSYPIWIDKNDTLILFANNTCLVAKYTYNPLIAIAKLGMNPHDIHFFYNTFLHDWNFIE